MKLPAWLWYLLNPPTPCILTEDDFYDGAHNGGLREGDLLPIVGGCPRAPGDKCDLLYGCTSEVVLYNDIPYYKLLKGGPVK